MSCDSAISLHFTHGLGDCANFAHAVALLSKAGHSVALFVEPDKRILFEDSNVTFLDAPEGAFRVPWEGGRSIRALRRDHYWLCNKTGRNALQPPFASNVDPQTVWHHLCQVKLRVRQKVSVVAEARVHNLIYGLQRPIGLLHPVGASSRRRKSLDHARVHGLCQCLLSDGLGSVIILDWHNDVIPPANQRIAHLARDWKSLAVSELITLISAADIFVGVDSGPLHVARLTETPVLGLYEHEYHHPIRVCLPRANQYNILSSEADVIPLLPRVRRAFNLISHPGPGKIPVEFISGEAARILSL